MTNVILIGGASHVGKSTLAQSLATSLNWPCQSTDSLARHPGRPWPAVRPHVAEHYQRLSGGAIFEFLLDHYRNMWPGIRALISQHTDDADAGPLVLEGSALRPEFIASVNTRALRATWLIASPSAIRERILRESSFDDASAEGNEMIERFIDRSLEDNKRIIETTQQLGLQCVDVEDTASMSAFTKACRNSVGP